MRNQFLTLFLSCLLASFIIPEVSGQVTSSLNISHDGNITSLVISPDGKYIYTGGTDGVIIKWSANNKSILQRFSGHRKDIKSIGITGDGTKLVSSSEDHTIKVWDTSSGKTIRTIADLPRNTIDNVEPNPRIAVHPTMARIAVISAQTHILLIDITTGSTIWKKKQSKAYDIKFNDDGTEIGLACYNSLASLQTSNGKSLGEITLGGSFEQYPVNGIEYFPEKRMWFFCYKGSISLADIKGGKLIVSKRFPTLKKAEKHIQSRSFPNINGNKCFYDSNSKLLLTNTSGAFDYNRFYQDKIGSGRTELYSFENPENPTFVNSLGSGAALPFISYASQTMAIAYRNTLEVFSISGEKKQVASDEKPLPNPKTPINVSFSSNNSYMAISFPEYIVLLDLTNGRRRVIRDYKNSGVNFVPNSNRFAALIKDNQIEIWDAPTLKPTERLEQSYSNLKQIGFYHTPSGLRIFKNKPYVAYRMGTTVMVMNYNTDQTVSQTKGEGKERIISFDLHPAEEGFFTVYSKPAAFDKNAYYENFVGPARTHWDLNNHTSTVSVKFSDDGKYLATTGKDNTIFISDVNTASWKVGWVEFITWKKIYGEGSYFAQVYFSPDNKYIAAVNSDGSITVYDYLEKLNYRGQYTGDITTKYVFKYLDFDEEKWLALNQSMIFTGNENAFGYINFALGDELIPLDNIYDNFFKPNLLAIQGGVTYEPTLNVSKLTPPPTVKILSPENKSSSSNALVEVRVQVEDAGGGVDEIRLYHNGKLIEGTQRGFKKVGTQSNDNIKVFTIQLVGGVNSIKATAFNNQRTESIPAEIVVNYQLTQQVKPNLYVIAIGINKYRNPKYNLNYAENDAAGFMRALESGAASIFGSINKTFVLNEAATRAGILAAFEKVISQAQPQDVFVFYYAGHGVMDGGSNRSQPQFYLVPHDVTKMYEADELLKEKGVSADDLLQLSKSLLAQKQLFVLDACQSGGALQTFAMRGAAEEKAIAQLARSTGTYFIAASGTEQFATEVATLGHGVFTYALIQTLKGDCRNTADKKVTVNMLKGCIEELVPDLTQQHKGEPQFPTGYGFGQDFPIGIVK